MSPLPSPQRPHRLRRVQRASRAENGEVNGHRDEEENDGDDEIDESDRDRSRDRNGNREEGSEIPALQRTHRTNGYRDGVTESKEKFIQEGFDEGYSLGAILGLRAGYILGGIEGIVRALGTERQAEATELLGSARKELDLKEIFGSDYFDDEGVWKYQVPGVEGEVTFQEVAEALFGSRLNSGAWI
jgi:hypothetical protein